MNTAYLNTRELHVGVEVTAFDAERNVLRFKRLPSGFLSVNYRRVGTNTTIARSISEEEVLCTGSHVIFFRGSRLSVSNIAKWAS